MGNCAIKPKVLKDSDEDLIPVERDTTAPNDHNNDPNAAEEAAAAARRSEKGKEILIDDDVEEHIKRQSLSLLFHEDKSIEKDITDLSPTKPEINNKTGASSEVSKLDTLSIMSSNDKAQDSFDVQTRNYLKVKIPKDSEVMTPETPKAKEQELKFPQDLESKIPNKTSEESKLPEASPPELSDINVTKETDVHVVLEDKNVQEVSEVKVAVAELLKVSDVQSAEDLEIEVPKVFELKTPKTEEPEFTIDKEATKVMTAEETVEAQEKIDKADV